MSTTHRMTVSIEDMEVEVKFSFTPGRPEVRYLRNGDPGYPAEPDETEVLSVKLLVGGPMEHGRLLETVRDWFETDEGMNKVDECVAIDHEEAREFAAEARRNQDG